MKTTLKLFNCRVNVGRDVSIHEVPKEKITERELRLLRTMHGNDMIKGLVQVGAMECEEMEEMSRLAYIYGQRRVERCFNIQLDDFEQWIADQEAQAMAEGVHVDTLRRLRGKEIAVEMENRIDVAPEQEAKPQSNGTLHLKKTVAAQPEA